MAQQTAVWWLAEQLFKDATPTLRQRALIEEAKEMHKNQVIDAHIEGQRVFDNYPHTQWNNDQAEQYYNETYND